MDRATFKLVMAIGVLLNSALYLTGVLVAGLAEHNWPALRLTLAACGITYLSYICHFVANHDDNDNWAKRARLLVLLSIAFGASAGVALLLG